MRGRRSRTLVLVCCAAPVLWGGPMATAAPAAPLAAVPFDVDGNGVADLVIGAPGEDTGAVRDAGSATVLLAGTPGVGQSGYAFHQGRPDIRGGAETGDRYGSAVASGDFDGDGHADLAVGVPGESGARASSGAVSVLYGASTYPSYRDDFWSQDSPGVPGGDEAGDAWGSAVAVGDLDGDGYDDLAVGAPGEDIGSASDAGAVTVLYGSSIGLTSARSVMLNQDTPGVEESAEPVDDADTDLHRGRDGFGSAVAIGDTTGDGRDELVVGVPNESVEVDGGAFIAGGGAVHVLLGRTGGVTGEGSSYWTQDSPGVLDQAEEQDALGDRAPGDAFGSALAVADVDGDGLGDIAVGIPREKVSQNGDETPYLQGAVALLRGDATGATASGNQFWHQDSPGVPGLARASDRFGASVALGDVDGDGRADLAAGAPGDSTGDSPTFESLGWGAVVVLRGSTDGLTTTGAQYWSQRTPGVPGIAEDGDAFGASVSLQQHGRGEQADLVVGVPGENGASGQVHVLYGSASGVITSGTTTLTQDTAGVPGIVEAGDAFAVVR